MPIYNENINNSLLTTLIKSRWTVFNILLFIYTYDFFRRRWDIFLRLFLYSSLLIIILFIQVIITKVTILPIDIVNRDFINMNRYIMYSYGLMPLLIPLGVITFVFKVKIKKKMILLGFVLMSIAWLVSITRRHIIGIIVYFVLAFLMDAYIRKRYQFILNNTVKISFLILSVVLISNFIVPRYLGAAWMGIEESFSILQSGKNLKGEKDVRMTFNRPFINQQFYKHPLLGTGFDDRWRTGKGDAQGYEASDYPFLAALAMYGIVGVLVFLPVYIVLIKSLTKDFVFLRNNPRSDPDVLFLLFFTLILFFVFHLLQYFNYFVAISVSGDITWYFSLSIYLAARSDFYHSNYLNSPAKQLSF